MYSSIKLLWNWDGRERKGGGFGTDCFQERRKEVGRGGGRGRLFKMSPTHTVNTCGIDPAQYHP